MRYSIRCPAFCDRSFQRGLSLVELMISITIGLLILSAMTTLFVNQSKTRAELDKSNRMIDNGRYALEVLSENLRLAGFYGELDPSSIALPTNSANGPCSTDPNDMSDAIRLHIQGYNAASATATIASPPCSLTSASLKSGSDILALRRADTSDPVPQAMATDGIHYLQVSSCPLDTAAAFVIEDAANEFEVLRPRDCTATSTTPYADLRRFIVQTYFVSPNNSGSDGIPTLKRRELDPAGSGAFVTTPLVEGIEFMQVEYGIDGFDTDADGIPDRFNAGDVDGVADVYSSCAACSDAQWANVVSVKLNIIARNIEPTAGYADTKTYFKDEPWEYIPSGSDRNYKRHAYTQAVRLVNPASRREAP